MDAIDFLVRHHRELEAQLSKLKKSDDVDQSEFNTLADSLAAHITVEEEIFYPAVKARRTEEILLESLEEHLSLKRVLADLLDVDSADQKFSPKLHVLAEQAEHHHKEEEEHLFPKVKKIMDEAHRETLGAEMRKRMMELLERAPRDRIRSQTDESASLT